MIPAGTEQQAETVLNRRQKSTTTSADSADAAAIIKAGVYDLMVTEAGNGSRWEKGLKNANDAVSMRSRQRRGLVVTR